MNRLYIYSDGTVSREPFNPFEAREDLKREVREIENRLRIPHKKCNRPDEKYLEEMYLNDPDVIKYRELMRKIWSFQAERELVKILPCCDYPECKRTELLYKVFYMFHDSTTGYTHGHIRCKDHLLEFLHDEELKESERSYSNLEIIPYRE